MDTNKIKKGFMSGQAREVGESRVDSTVCERDRGRERGSRRAVVGGLVAGLGDDARGEGARTFATVSAASVAKHPLPSNSVSSSVTSTLMKKKAEKLAEFSVDGAVAQSVVKLTIRELERLDTDLALLSEATQSNKDSLHVAEDAVREAQKLLTERKLAVDKAKTSLAQNSAVHTFLQTRRDALAAKLKNIERRIPAQSPSSTSNGSTPVASSSALNTNSSLPPPPTLSKPTPSKLQFQQRRMSTASAASTTSRDRSSGFTKGEISVKDVMDFKEHLDKESGEQALRNKDARDQKQRDNDIRGSEIRDKERRDKEREKERERDRDREKERGQERDRHEREWEREREREKDAEREKRDKEREWEKERERERGREITSRDNIFSSISTQQQRQEVSPTIKVEVIERRRQSDAAASPSYSLTQPGQSLQRGSDKSHDLQRTERKLPVSAGSQVSAGSKPPASRKPESQTLSTRRKRERTTSPCDSRVQHNESSAVSQPEPPSSIQAMSRERPSELQSLVAGVSQSISSESGAAVSNTQDTILQQRVPPQSRPLQQQSRSEDQIRQELKEKLHLQQTMALQPETKNDQANQVVRPPRKRERTTSPVVNSSNILPVSQCFPESRNDYHSPRGHVPSGSNKRNLEGSNTPILSSVSNTANILSNNSHYGGTPKSSISHNLYVAPCFCAKALSNSVPYCDAFQLGVGQCPQTCSRPHLCILCAGLHPSAQCLEGRKVCVKWNIESGCRNDCGREHRCLRCASISHIFINCPLWTMGSGGGACFAWNTSHFCKVPDCTRPHECARCGAGSHPAIVCPMNVITLIEDYFTVRREMNQVANGGVGFAEGPLHILLPSSGGTSGNHLAMVKASGSVLADIPVDVGPAEIMEGLYDAAEMDRLPLVPLNQQQHQAVFLQQQQMRAVASVGPGVGGVSAPGMQQQPTGLTQHQQQQYFMQRQMMLNGYPYGGMYPGVAGQAMNMGGIGVPGPPFFASTPVVGGPQGFAMLNGTQMQQMMNQQNMLHQQQHQQQQNGYWPS